MPTINFKLVLLMCLWTVVNASMGDRSLYYQNCKKACSMETCMPEEKLQEFYKNQQLSLKITFWSCTDECKYNCTWKTTQEFINAKLSVPQFHGKWPFVRIFGMQEPASVLFSLLNLATYTYGTVSFVMRVPSNSIMYSVSLSMGLFGINAWIWSAIFHTRDVDWTEKMDYFSAIILVSFGVFTCICRLSYGINSPSATKGRGIRIAAFTIIFIFIILHVSYLSFVHFNYGYNMIANIVAGMASVIMWVFYHWITRGKYSHQWRGSLSMIAVAVSIVLEVLDFVPIYWILDSHALWHLSTFPIPIYWMSFLADDALALEHTIRYKIV